jgi:Asp/Glu/hydantoin racemase
MRILVLGGLGMTTAGARRRDGDASAPEVTPSPFQKYASPGTQVDSGNPNPAWYSAGAVTAGLNGSDRYLRWWMPVPAIVRTAVWAEQNGYDALLQTNNFEHGVEASRIAVRIPVIGLCRTTMHLAANISDRIGVTVPLDGYFVLARRLLQSYGLEGYVSGMRSLGFEDVPPADQVERLRPIMFERTVEIMREMVKDGAECIVPLGGAVVPSVLDPVDLQREVGAPVLNPRQIGVRTAEMYVSLGLTHSEITYGHASLITS